MTNRPIRGARSICLAACLLIAAASTALASSFIQLDVPALSARSSSVVHANVIDQQSSWNDEHTMIFTHVTLQPIGAPRGDEVLPSLIVRVPGGTVDGFTAEMEGAPQFRVGDEVVAFITAWDDGALKVTGYEQGLSRIVTERGGAKVLRGGSADGLSMDELASQLASVKE